MKKIILVDQHSVINSGMDLKLQDCVILQYIAELILSTKTEKRIINGKCYVKITHCNIIEDLPLLGINTKMGILKHVQNLRAYKLITRVVSSSDNCTYYALGINYELLSNDTNIKQNIQQDTIQENNEHTKRTRNANKNSDTKQCLFCNSKFAKFEDFSAQFANDIYKDIDIYYYYCSVRDWSASGGHKKRDWVATARNFMRSDNQKGKLKKLQTNTMQQELANNLLNIAKQGDLLIWDN